MYVNIFVCVCIYMFYCTNMYKNTCVLCLPDNNQVSGQPCLHFICNHFTSHPWYHCLHFWRRTNMKETMSLVSHHFVILHPIRLKRFSCLQLKPTMITHDEISINSVYSLSLLALWCTCIRIVSVSHLLLLYGGISEAPVEPHRSPVVLSS